MARPVTWQNVNAGNYGAANSLFTNSARGMREGFDGLTKLGLHGQKIEVDKAQRADDDALGMLLAQSAMEGSGDANKELLTRAMEQGLSGKALSEFSQQVQANEGASLQRQAQQFMVDNQQAVLDDKFTSSKHGRDMQDKQFGRTLSRDNKQDKQWAKQFGLTVDQFNHRRDMNIKNFENGKEEFDATMGLNKEKFTYKKAVDAKDQAYRTEAQKHKVKMDYRTADTRDSQHKDGMEFKRDSLAQAGKHFTLGQTQRNKEYEGNKEQRKSEFDGNMSQRKTEYSGNMTQRKDEYKGNMDQRKFEYTGNMSHKKATQKQQQDQFNTSMKLSEDKFTYKKIADNNARVDRKGEFYSDQAIQMQNNAQATTNATNKATAATAKQKRDDAKWLMTHKQKQSIATERNKSRKITGGGVEKDYSYSKRGLADTKRLGTTMDALNMEGRAKIEVDALVRTAQSRYGDKVDMNAVNRMLTDQVGFKWFSMLGDSARHNSKHAGSKAPNAQAFMEELVKYGGVDIPNDSVQNNTRDFLRPNPG